MGADQITRFARVDFRNDERIFGIKDEDRLLHVYIIGKTGTGKSTLMENMAPQDLMRGNGFALIDPHGDLVARIAARIPKRRRPDIIHLDATDPSQPFGYNPLRHVREDRIALAASGMMDVFKKMWPDAWGVRMEHILRNVLMALLEQRDATLHDVLRIFSDKEFRRSVGRSLRNEPVRTFLLKEFDQFSFGYRADGTAPIQNKVGAFLADPLLDRILTAPEKDIRIRRIMDEGKVLLVNLAKGSSAACSTSTPSRRRMTRTTSTTSAASSTRTRRSSGSWITSIAIAAMARPTHRTTGDQTMLTPCIWCHHLADDHVRAGKERYCTRCDCRYYAHARPQLAANRLVGRLRRTEER